MSKGKFIFGFALGVAAGIAAKYLYDNQETVCTVVNEKVKIAKEELHDFVDFASDKVATAGRKVSKKASEYADMADEQLQEFKDAFKEANYTDEDKKQV